MITKENTLSITKLRQNTSQVLKKLGQKEGPFYVFRRSEPKAVILDIDQFNTLEEILGEFLDTQELLSVTEKEIKESLPWKEFKKKQSLA